MTRKQLGRWIWPPATLIAVVFVLVVEGRKATHSASSVLALAAAFACILAAGVLDRLRRYEERAGSTRFAALALLGIGLILAFAVITTA